MQFAGWAASSPTCFMKRFLAAWAQGGFNGSVQFSCRQCGSCGPSVGHLRLSLHTKPSPPLPAPSSCFSESSRRSWYLTFFPKPQIGEDLARGLAQLGCWRKLAKCRGWPGSEPVPIHHHNTETTTTTQKQPPQRANPGRPPIDGSSVKLL